MKDRLTFELYGEAYNKINSLAGKQGVSTDEVIKKALALYTQIKFNKSIDTSCIYVKDKKGTMFKVNI